MNRAGLLGAGAGTPAPSRTTNRTAESETPAHDAGAFAPYTQPRLDQLRERADDAWHQACLTWVSGQALFASMTRARQVDLLRESSYARLFARAATMPVIEQAKGVLMAQQRCGAERAFTLLRQASQRSNVPVRELAERIVSSQHAHAGHRDNPGTPPAA